MNEPVIIAFLGKGGSGKSILSSLTGKLAIDNKNKLLLIDADPAMGLATALGVEGYKTIGEARETIIQKAKNASGKIEKETLGNEIDVLLMECLFETPDYSLLVMGRTDSIGCYCPVNTLLKRTIKAIASRYDVVIIDAEAGMEQVSRQVTESVHYPVLLTDNSLRGVRTGILINETINSSNQHDVKKTGIIFNRVDRADTELVEKAVEAGIQYYGSIPADENITAWDRKGLPALEMPDEAVSLTALKTILKKILQSPCL